MGMILRIASSRIVGQGDIVGRSGYFSLNLSANSVMRGRLDARRTLKSLVADLRIDRNYIIFIYIYCLYALYISWSDCRRTPTCCKSHCYNNKNKYIFHNLSLREINIKTI